MGTAGTSSFNLGPRLTLIFAALIALILGGNALVVSQFYVARNVTDQLTAANQQLIAVLQLQANLLSLHRRLDDLARSVDLSRLVTEAESLREALREQTQQTRTAIANLPSDTVVDPSFLPTLDTIDVTLSSEIEAILELAKSGDRGALAPRVSKEFDTIETQTAILVNSINEQASRELARGVTEMSSIQRRVLIIVPATALSTFFIAAFFGWSIARRFIELRLEERVGERLRIARELHDTLLQSFHGLMFQFQAAQNLMSRRPNEAMRSLDEAISDTKKALAESRNAIQGLRSEAIALDSLAESLIATSQELAHARNGNHEPPNFHLIEEGERRTLSPHNHNEIRRIALEILRNAYQHARARRIEAEIRYGDQMLRLRIRDDGKGMDPEVLKVGGRPGHWGLRGVRERAEKIGAQVDFWSEAGTGTEVQVAVPAPIAYETSHDSFWSRLVRRVRDRAQR